MTRHDPTLALREKLDRLLARAETLRRRRRSAEAVLHEASLIRCKIIRAELREEKRSAA